MFNKPQDNEVGESRQPSSDRIKVSHKTPDPFSRVSKKLLDDPDLSWGAKGVAAYLLGKPVNWCVQVRDIINHGTEGETSIRNYLNELRRLGYAQYDKHERKNYGKWGGGEWRISDTPCFDKAIIPKRKRKKKEDSKPSPRLAVPHSVTPHTVEPHLSKKDKNKNEENKIEVVQFDIETSFDELFSRKVAEKLDDVDENGEYTW